MFWHGFYHNQTIWPVGSRIETKSDVHHPILIRWFELFDWANAGLTARNPNPGFDSQRHNFNINDYSIDCDLFLFYDILSIGLLTTEM